MKNVSKLFQVVFFASIFSLMACSPSTEAESKSAGIQSITPTEASKMFAAKEAVIIDVREQNEWDAGHIPGAIHIPVASLNSRLAELEQYKDSPVIMQCRSGRRSAQGAVALNAAGFKNLYNMEGGILAWDKAGLETEK
jgi:rhodanese-related sulfurtransferase